ncbi:MAG: hypothetical protein O3B31_13060 [Chloroflexi bacterium]|nr:hypothetical protein [Chloroflexota bacterium]MDA1004250.1 hypothetical protein [Chloroflexota bacterium]
MKIVSTLALIAGITGGYVAARQLLAREDLGEWLPQPLRPTADAVRARLLLARQRAGTVVDEFERERASAERELMRDYHERVGRPLDAGATRPPATGT